MMARSCTRSSMTVQVGKNSGNFFSCPERWLNTDASGRYWFGYPDPRHLGNRVPPRVKPYFDFLGTFLNEILQANETIDTIYSKMWLLLTLLVLLQFPKYIWNTLHAMSSPHSVVFDTTLPKILIITTWINANVRGPHMAHSYGLKTREWRKTKLWTVRANFSNFWWGWHSFLICWVW